MSETKLAYRKIALETLGCKLNQAETESLARQLSNEGYEIVDSPDDADIYILNTCTVTHVADRKARQRLRRTVSVNPMALVIAIGCYAQRSPKELRKAGAQIVLGITEKDQLPELLAERASHNGRGTHSFNWHRTRAFVKIQQGCDNFCSYCIVPFIRGAESSIPANQVIDEINARVNEGYKEVVLTGTRIGGYAANGAATLHELIGRVLTETSIERLRISSIQPQEMSPELLELWRNDHLCKHLHIPLQCGSDTVLQRMGRGYSTTDFEEAVLLAKQMIVGLSITTDIMVGFPGETDDEFEESYRFCEKMGFAHIHVFPYSKREGTRAIGISSDLNERVKKKRVQRMLMLSGSINDCFRSSFIGQTLPVLWEHEDEGTWSGFTSNYVRVFARSDEGLTNTLARVKLTKVCNGGLMGVFGESC